MADDSYVNTRRFEAANFELMYWQERLEAARTKDDASLSRDEFAARAMQGLLSKTSQGGWNEPWAELAFCAYAIADAMIIAAGRRAEARQ